MFSTLFLLATIFVGCSAQNSNLVWYEIDLPTEDKYTAVATSASGQNVVVSERENVLVSSDYGVSWTQSAFNSPAVLWTALACDHTGKNVTGVSSNIGVLFSQNYGLEFSYSLIDEGPFLTVAMSSDSQYQYAAAYGEYIYQSETYGHSWNELRSADKHNWQALATNSNGSIVIAGVDNGALYYSHNYGSDWAICGGIPQAALWSAIASSGSGQYVVATLATGQIYVSSNYGLSFVLELSIAYPGAVVGFLGVTSDVTGQYLAASSSSSGIYLSDNYGVADSWKVSSSASPALQYQQLASNAAGDILVATTANPGNVYTTYNVGTSDDNTESNGGGSGSALSTGALAGVVVGAVAGVVLLTFLLYFAATGKVLGSVCFGSVGSGNADLNRPLM